MLNEAAMALLRAGHTPVIGANIASPMVGAGGGTSEAWLRLSLALADRCDACRRIGGLSVGAAAEARFQSAGRPVYCFVGEVPEA